MGPASIVDLEHEIYESTGTIDAEDVPQPWQPNFEALPGGGYAYALDDHGVRVELRYLRREHGHLIRRGGRTLHVGRRESAQRLAVLRGPQPLVSDRPKDPREVLRGARAHQARRPSTGWARLMRPVSRRLRPSARGRRHRARRREEVPERDFEVCGLSVPADATSMLIAHGDSLKSMLLLLILGTLASPDTSSSTWTGSGPRLGTERVSGGCSETHVSTGCGICAVGHP